MSQNLTEGPMPDRILSTPLPGPLMTESEDTITYPPPEDPIATSQERVDITLSVVDSHDEQEQEEQSQILHSISQSPSPARQSPFHDNNTMTKQFASISLSSTQLARERSLTPPFWDLSPDESSPSRTKDEGPPAASLLLDATQSVDVVQSKSEDGQNDKEQVITTGTIQTEDLTPANENIVPSTPPALTTTTPLELSERMGTPRKSQDVSDGMLDGASDEPASVQGAREPTPIPLPGVYLAIVNEGQPVPHELDKDDSTTVLQGSVIKDPSESSDDQEEEDRILLYPAKPWGSSYKKRFTPSARLITKLIEKHHADSDYVGVGPMRTRRQRRPKAIPTTSYIPTSDASAEASADTDRPRRSRKLPLSRLKPKSDKRRPRRDPVAKTHKNAPMKRPGGPTGTGTRTGRDARSGNKELKEDSEWEEDSEWNLKSSPEDSDDDVYLSSTRKRPRLSSPPSVRSSSRIATLSHPKKGNNKAKPNRKRRLILECVEIPPWKGSSKGEKPQVNDTEAMPAQPSTTTKGSKRSPRTRSENHTESTNAALIAAHSEEWYIRTFDGWWIEAVVIPISGEIALRVHGHIHVPNTTVVWHSSHITNVINPTLVATHKKKLYKLEGELDALQMDNNGFTAVEIKRFSKGFPSDWLEVLKNWTYRRSQNNQVNSIPGPTPPPRKMSENSSCESTTEEQQLASLPSPPRQSSPTWQPRQERLPKAQIQVAKAVSPKDKEQEKQPLARTPRSLREAPEPSPDEKSASEEPSTGDLCPSRKVPEQSMEEESPEESSMRTLRSLRKAPEPPLEAEPPKEAPTRTRRSLTIAPTLTTEEEAIPEENSVSEYEPAMEVESISDDEEPAPIILAPLTMKRNRIPKSFYKALESSKQEYDGESNQRYSHLSGGYPKTKRLRDDSDEILPTEEEPHVKKRRGIHHTRSPTQERDSNRELRELSATGPVEVLQTRLRSETRDTRTPLTNSPASKSSVIRARSSRRASRSEATPPKRLIVEAVTIPVWNRKMEKKHMEPEIKEEKEEEEDGGGEKPFELVEGPPHMPLNALSWHPSLSTFKNFRPASMSPSLYTRSQNVVEQLKLQTSDGPMGEEMDGEKEEESQGEGMEGVMMEDKVKERSSAPPQEGSSYDTHTSRSMTSSRAHSG